MVLTWNPDNVNVPAKIVLSNGNRDATFQVTDNKTIESDYSRSTGKYYFEIEYVTAGGSANYLGIGNAGFTTNALPGWSADGKSWAYYPDLGRKFHSGHYASFGPTGGVKAVGTIYMFAVDLDTGEFWTGANGSWFNSTDYDASDPAGSCPAMYTDSGISAVAMLPMVGGQNIGTNLRSYLGYSELNYTPPSGFTVWGGIPPVGIKSKCLTAINNFPLLGGV